MIKALQSGGRAMQVQAQRHEIIANNLANANTPGFKKLIGRVNSQLASTAGTAETGGSGLTPQLIVDSVPSTRGGALQATGNALDAAIVGDGYFLIETPDGEMLSRDGNFTLNAQGELLHSSGYPVLADGGAIAIQQQGSILPDGTILDGDLVVGRLSLVRPAAGGELRSEGNNLSSIAGEIEEVPAEEINIVSGHVEGSNVDAIEEMVRMIQAFRAYEIAQKVTQAADDTLKTAVERVGVVRA
ncbi:MAG: flagellar hook-basal body protein [bacterium]|nr:flagellar hook-basal body protein [bacterium]